MDFHGRDAYVAQRERNRQPAYLCTLTMQGNTDSRGVDRFPVGQWPLLDPKNGDVLFDELGRRSYTTSIAFGPSVGKTIAMGYLPYSYCKEGNELVMEYFAEQFEGFAFTEHGWVQSYGSRYVKPPILFGDVRRPDPVTVRWWEHASSCTERPVKAMLTGPVTMLQWSFVRDDQPRSETTYQLALAVRDEVADLEEAGAPVIQVDEPALREGLPLRRDEWDAYLDWAVNAFRLSTGGVRPETQVHTHMCYSEFNDIIEHIAAMDADVLLIENARSDAELLEVFREFDYDHDIGPGVYDIHSPRVPPVEEMAEMIRASLSVLPAERLWVNPDCGLKTRDYEEVVPALENMVEAARRAREQVDRSVGATAG